MENGNLRFYHVDNTMVNIFVISFLLNLISNYWFGEYNSKSSKYILYYGIFPKYFYLKDPIFNNSN